MLLPYLLMAFALAVLACQSLLMGSTPPDGAVRQRVSLALAAMNAIAVASILVALAHLPPIE